MGRGVCQTHTIKVLVGFEHEITGLLVNAFFIEQNLVGFLFTLLDMSTNL